MIVFNRRAGRLYDAAGTLIASGIWSGHNDAANDPTREREKGVGPLPKGVYMIGPLRDGGALGPDVMNLDPAPGTNTFGRSLFRIHGDNSTPAPHDASDGCIIAPHQTRIWIDAQKDRRINVV